MSTSTSNTANNAAILTAGLVTRVSAGALTEDYSALSPDPWVYPAPTDAGHPVDTIAADVAIGLHADIRARRVWLRIDRAGAPLTGSYTVTIGGTACTYDATAGAPADVDALLAGWAAAIEAAAGPSGTDVLESAGVGAWIPGGSDDCIELRGKVADLAGYTTFAVAAPSAPAGAVLVLWREPDTAKLTAFTRWPTNNATNARLDSLATGAQRTAWHAPPGGSDLDVPSKGYDERIYLGGRSAIYLHLHTPTSTDAALTIVTSGAGLYGAVWVVSSATAEAVQG